MNKNAASASKQQAASSKQQARSAARACHGAVCEGQRRRHRAEGRQQQAHHFRCSHKVMGHACDSTNETSRRPRQGSAWSHAASQPATWDQHGCHSHTWAAGSGKSAWLHQQGAARAAAANGCCGGSCTAAAAAPITGKSWALKSTHAHLAWCRTPGGTASAPGARPPAG